MTIRGLAGSGKTIVLALKAAYLHAQYPEWNIAVTFNTRSLKNQFKDLIERFCIEKKGEMPAWNKVKILQAWGSSKNEGIYFNICMTHNIEYHDFTSAKSYKYASKEHQKTVFDNVCNKALNEIKEFQTTYDAILVDEAQDLSESFLKLCFNILKEPKRLIYAYDELQKLNEGSPLGNPENIFGKSAEDTILNKCYRNSRPLLVTAHSLGFGLYRKEGLVQFFDQPQLWKELGYYIKEGQLLAGNHVKLYRTHETSPEYLERHSSLDDLIIFKSFDNSKEQAEWIANEIEKNLSIDELLYTDIIVINPDAITTKDEVALIRSMLLEKKISSHIAGEFNADVFFKESSIAFTGIFRAKGNEVPMVYIINGHDCYMGSYNNNLDLRTKRNTLFTAITRSKAWVRISGIGKNMKMLIDEYEEVKSRNYELHFNYPTEKEIEHINIIHRDISSKEKEILSNDINILKSIPDILNRIKSGDNLIEDYPEDLQIIINSLINK